MLRLLLQADLFNRWGICLLRLLQRPCPLQLTSICPKVVLDPRRPEKRITTLAVYARKLVLRYELQTFLIDPSCTKVTCQCERGTDSSRCKKCTKDGKKCVPGTSAHKQSGVSLFFLLFLRPFCLLIDFRTPKISLISSLMTWRRSLRVHLLQMARVIAMEENIVGIPLPRARVPNSVN